VINSCISGLYYATRSLALTRPPLEEKEKVSKGKKERPRVEVALHPLAPRPPNCARGGGKRERGERKKGRAARGQPGRFVYLTILFP